MITSFENVGSRLPDCIMQAGKNPAEFQHVRLSPFAVSPLTSSKSQNK